MHIFATIDPIRRHWLSLVVAEDLAYGVTSMFGKADQPFQILLRGLMPLPYWYGLLVVAAFLIAFGFNVSAGIFGTVGWGCLAAASMITVGNGSALSPGASVSLLGWAYIHLLVFYDVGSGLDAARERSQRRP
jgi:hypothetical protein